MSRYKNMIKSTLAVILPILIILLVCCQTSPADDVGKNPIDISFLTWPDFPDPSGVVTMTDGVVSMPLSYWIAVTKYAIDTDAIRQIIGGMDAVSK